MRISFAWIKGSNATKDEFHGIFLDPEVYLMDILGFLANCKFPWKIHFEMQLIEHRKIFTEKSVRANLNTRFDCNPTIKLETDQTQKGGFS